MKQDIYDDNIFFAKYSQMQRSIGGLESAGEWHILKTMFPSFAGKRVLDLGCGFGWHCRYASEQNAVSVLGIDISEKMLGRAKRDTSDPKIKYLRLAIEDIDFSAEEFDVVISSLAFHYVKNFDDVCKKVYHILSHEGSFIFSVEHPIFTACVGQDWCYGPQGEKLHWPIDDYQDEGLRVTRFLGEEVIKYHRTVAGYMNIVMEAGFRITSISEPIPSQDILNQDPEMRNELRRPMFLLLAAIKD